ncbi:unnamed protein product [Amoebophrya sp. A25]|nr:unnamed protein product [Amoebophrya sp. A25]|eukprot:GSA25T00010912001.1
MASASARSRASSMAMSTTLLKLLCSAVLFFFYAVPLACTAIHQNKKNIQESANAFLSLVVQEQEQGLPDSVMTLWESIFRNHGKNYSLDDLVKKTSSRSQESFIAILHGAAAARDGTSGSAALRWPLFWTAGTAGIWGGGRVEYAATSVRAVLNGDVYADFVSKFVPRRDEQEKARKKGPKTGSEVPVFVWTCKKMEHPPGRSVVWSLVNFYVVFTFYRPENAAFRHVVALSVDRGFRRKKVAVEGWLEGKGGWVSRHLESSKAYTTDAFLSNDDEVGGLWMTLRNVYT